MAKPIVTQERVNETADALVATGEEPSIITVQARIGGGSYTTIKRYLDVWKQQQGYGNDSCYTQPFDISTNCYHPSNGSCTGPVSWFWLPDPALVPTAASRLRSGNHAVLKIDSSSGGGC